MKRYLIIASIILVVVGLAFVPPKPNPHRPRRTREAPPFYATETFAETETPTATVAPTQTESARFEMGAQNIIVISTPLVDIGLPPLPPTLSVPPIEGYPGPAPTQGGYPGP